MTNKQRNVLKYFKTFKKSRPHDAARRMGFLESAPIAQQIKALERNGLLKKSGSGKKTIYTYNIKL